MCYYTALPLEKALVGANGLGPQPHQKRAPSHFATYTLPSHNPPNTQTVAAAHQLPRDLTGVQPIAPRVFHLPVYTLLFMLDRCYVM